VMTERQQKTVTNTRREPGDQERSLIWKRRQMAMLLVVAALLLLVLGVACSSPAEKMSDAGFIVMNVTSGLGGDSPNEQVVTYTMRLSMEGIDRVFVNWVEPVLAEEILDRLQSPDNQVVVNQFLGPGDTLEVSGQFVFNSEGLSKPDLASLEPLISGMQVSTEWVLALPGWEEEGGEDRIAHVEKRLMGRS
jgi:hypothetical protein